ncbi:MFS transporter [Saccharopolyspora sp. NPDC050389]|uniref:MFS transporter n=1 Tax=Saccharopolyspora sp. NPDC050389 TaxID=3155516 RepID=UPI0033FA9EBC
MRYASVVRRILLRATLFILPVSATWALLPIVSNQALHLGAAGYGILLGTLDSEQLPAHRRCPACGLSSRQTSCWPCQSAVLFAAEVVLPAVVSIVDVSIVVLFFADYAWCRR